MALKKQLEDVHLNLNKSYNKLEYHKETLDQQAERVKEQIINNIVMQIEAFNQRKNWLINQLELVKTEKMESILREQDSIRCSMLKVNNFINDKNKFSNVQIKEELEKINNNLGEETRPFLGFRSDSVLLREIISQYGVILKQYIGHFADPTKPSISLPRVVEEEDEEDNISFTRKYENQNKIDQNVLHITKHSTNPSIVKAWLMTTNTNEINDNLTESDSCIKTDSADFVNSKKTKEEFLIRNLKNELWLPKHENWTKTKHLKENLKSKINMKMQHNNPWLLESNDDEKEIDHSDLIKKVCKVGSCKTFYGCSKVKNCCNNLIIPNKPFWNKWLIDNNIINRELLNNPLEIRNIFASKFSQVLQSANEKWLDTRYYKKNIESVKEKMDRNPQLSLNNKTLKPGYSSNKGFNKSISLNHQQECFENKDLIDKSFEKSKMKDEESNNLSGEIEKLLALSKQIMRHLNSTSEYSTEEREEFICMHRKLLEILAAKVNVN